MDEVPRVLDGDVFLVSRGEVILEDGDHAQHARPIALSEEYNRRPLAVEKPLGMGLTLY